MLLLPPKFVTLFWELMVGRIRQFTLDAAVAFCRCAWLRSLSESLCTWQQIKINIRLRLKISIRLRLKICIRLRLKISIRLRLKISIRLRLKISIRLRLKISIRLKDKYQT